MKFPIKSAVWLFVAAFAAPALFFGQGYPMPGSSSQPPVLYGNVPTYPYSAPIVTHRGRFLDSTKVRELQAPIRTFRAERIAIVPERDRIYMKFGSALVSFRLSTFFTSDLNGPMGAMSGRDPGEQYLQYAGWVYPEKQGQWVTLFQDGQERMGPGFDWDDRGYVYFPARIFGWGIVKDTNGDFEFVKQYGGPLGGPGSDVGPTGIISFKHGGKYYAFVYDTAGMTGPLFDVTDPANAQYVKTLTHGIRSFAKTTVGGADVIGYTDTNTGEIKIFSAASFVAGAGPEKVFSPSAGLRFLAIDSDGSRFFGVEGSSAAPGKLAIIAANGSSIQSYNDDRYSIPGDRFSPSSVTHSMGVVTTVGYGGGGNTLHMFRLTSGAPQYVDFKDYFKKYYSGTTENGKQYAAPGFCNIVHSGIFYKDGSKEYVLYGANGLGDVYQIQASDGIGLEKEPTTGTPNPYGEGTAGPFYGDVFRFKTSSTGAATAIDVNYGNPEASSGNTAPATTGQTLSYRYSGLSSAASIQQTRTVRITAAGDTTKTASVNVTMEVPAARVRGWRATGIKDPALLFIQPNASATAPLVLGDSFVDASDGSIESHFSKWTLDGAAPVSLLPNEKFDAGQCGSHTLSFSAVYGAYDNFVSRTANDFTVGVSNINYAVAPFASRITTVASDASGLRFRPDIRVGTNAITGGSGAAATIKWELLDAAGGQIRASQVASTLADTAEFFVSAAELATAKSVRLTVALADANTITGQGCAGMASSSDSVQLIVPDPIVAVNSGCTNVGSPCSVKATSASGQNTSGWTYTWFLGGVQKTTTTANTYSPAAADLTQVGSYSVKVRVQNQAGIVADSNPISFSLAGAVCTAVPDGVLSFTWAGTDGCVYPNCTSTSQIKFNPKGWGYTFQDCDTFSWNFGDGTSSTEKYPVHKFASDNTYSVVLTVTNSQTATPRQVAQAVKLGNSTPPPPPPPPPGCDAPSQMVGFNMRGNTTGCTGLIGAPDCATGEAISFTAVNFPESKAFQSCDTFTWDFGDGTNSSQRNPVKYYSAAGNYTVKMTVSNTSGSVTASLPIKVAGGNPGGGGGDPNCKIPDGSRMYIEYSAPSGCSNLPGSNPCNPGEVVTISLKALGSFQSCDSFDWNFGDGTSSANTKTTTVQHQFPATLPEYTVTVTIKNTAGSATVSEKVKFGLQGVEKPTSVDFSWGSTTPIVGTPVTFTATANAPGSYPVTSWQWNFGDGVTGTGNPVQHVFSTEGPWTVTLTASNAGGSAAPVSKQINVLKANAFTYLLPVVSHLPGANGSQWRTDLQIYNANVGEGDVQLEFELTNKSLKKSFKLSASTLVYEDFMSFFTDGDWAGPVIVRGAATHDLQIWTRTYSVGASGIGTYGHLIPAVRIDDQSFTAGESTLYMTGVSATPKYRTNIYLLNLTSQPMPVTITAYEGQFGAAVGQLSQQVAPFQLTPISATQITGAPADKPFSIAIKGTSDGLIAYESVVDNGSNDPIYIPAMATAALGKAAMKNQVVPSIGHFQSWRSDVTIFNPDDQAVQFDLAFYDTTGALKAEAKDKILPAKGLLQLDDILRSDAMSVPEDIIGTLRLSVDSPLADQFPVVAQRNYSDAGDQKRFGQGILGFGAADANVKPGKPAIIPAVRNDQLYKSNVGLINVGAADATIQLTLLDQATGQPVGVYPVTLKPNESRILPEAIPNVFLSTTDRGSIKVEVTNDGLVWAFAAIIDRATSDPEYVPAIQLD